jgi:hypothetical protein
MSAVDDLVKSLETGQQIQKTVEAVSATVDPKLAGLMPKEEPVDFIVTGLPNGGRVYRDKKTGRLGYADQNISGGPEMAQAVLDQLQAGTPKAEIRTPYQVAQSQMRQDVIQQAGMPATVGQKIAEGAFGIGSFTDEALAAAVAQRTGRPYEEVLNQARLMSKSMQGEYPVGSEAAKMTGLVSSLFAGGPIAKEGIKRGIPSAVSAYQRGKTALQGMPPLAQQAATVAGASSLAAGEGALYGFGEGETFEDRLSKSGQRATLQALFAAPIAVVLPWAGRMIAARQGEAQVVRELSGQLGVSREAAVIIKKQLDDGKSLDETVAALQRAGDQRMVADANDAVKVLLDAAAASSGAGRQAVNEAVGGRVEESARRVLGGLDETIGAAPPAGKTVTETIAEGTRQARKEAYSEAYATPIDYASDAGRMIEDVMSRIPTNIAQDALNTANALLQAKGLRNQQIMADIADDGTVVLREMPNVQQVDILKQVLQDLAEKETNQFAQKTALGQTYADLARQLKEAASLAVPRYGEAVALGKENILSMKAGEMGQELLRSTTRIDDVIAAMKGADQSEKAAIRLGFRRGMDYLIGDVKRAAGSSKLEEQVQMQKILRELSSGANRAKVQEILGPQQSQKLFKQLDEAKAAFELQSAVSVGSQTAVRQAVQADVEEQLGGGIFRSFFEADPKGFTTKARDLLTGAGEAYKTQRKDKIYSEIIDVLTGRTGREADLAIKYVKEAIDKGTISQAKASVIANAMNNAFKAGQAGVVIERAVEGISP